MDDKAAPLEARKTTTTTPCANSSDTPTGATWLKLDSRRFTSSSAWALPQPPVETTKTRNGLSELNVGPTNLDAHTEMHTTTGDTDSI